MRTADIRRDTRETRIQLSLNLDGTGKADIATGVGFLDHMLELFARHGDFDLIVRCQGDTQVDGHHSVEDIGICLGRAFAEALGDKRGITRYGQFLLPMDETLVLVACDLSGRPFGRRNRALSRRVGGRATFPAGTIWAGPWICPPKGWGTSIRSWARSSSWPSSGRAPCPSTSGRWPGRTPTTFWRPCSRARAGP